MPALEKLIEPISGDKPCGEDIWLTEGRFQLQQPLEESWKNGQEPKWEALSELALEQLQRSRDLRIVIVLCLASLRTEGLDGFWNGVNLLRGLLEAFWDQIHPRLDDPDDPVRANVLSNLSAPLGSDTPYQFVQYLQESPLCRSAAGATYSLNDLKRADSGKIADESEQKPHPSREQIEAALRATGKERLAGTSRRLGELLDQVGRIETIVGSNGGGPPVDFQSLKGTLSDIITELAPYSGEAPQGIKCPHCEKEIKLAPGAATPAICPYCEREIGKKLPPSTAPGAINSRADADAALAAVSDYLKRAEPSSPVPFLLQRARRLLRLDFMESMKDLAPDTLEKFNSLFGIQEPAAPPENKNE